MLEIFDNNIETNETLENIKCVIETKINQIGMTGEAFNDMLLKMIMLGYTLINILAVGIYWWMTYDLTILSIVIIVCISYICVEMFLKDNYKKYLVLDNDKTECCICKDKKYCYKLGCSDKHHICVECGDGLKISKCPLCRKCIECFVITDLNNNKKTFKNSKALTIFQLYENIRLDGTNKSY